MLVTNDEMRDHLFQLLGNDFFPKWKERHQVFIFSRPMMLFVCDLYHVLFPLTYIFHSVEVTMLAFSASMLLILEQQG